MSEECTKCSNQGRVAELEAELHKLAWTRDDRAAELEAELAKVKEQWKFAAKAQVERSEKAEADLSACRSAGDVLMAEVEGLREERDALVAARTAEYPGADSFLLDGWRARAEAAEAKLAEVEKLRHAISVQCGEERKARHAAEKVNAAEVLAKRTNLNAQLESLKVELAEVEAERDEAVGALGEDVALMFKRSRRAADALRVKLEAAEAKLAEVTEQRRKWQKEFGAVSIRLAEALRDTLEAFEATRKGVAPPSRFLDQTAPIVERARAALASLEETP